MLTEIRKVNTREISKEEFKRAFTAKLETVHGKTLEQASDWDLFTALAYVVRDYISHNWVQHRKRALSADKKQVYYFSIEFLPGRMMDMNLINLGIREVCEQGLRDLGLDLNVLEDLEEDAGIGNGGLGRLAACFLDSMAALNLSGHGYGIRYRYGFFEQRVFGGHQQELPDNWLKDGSYVWEYRRPEDAIPVRFGGNVRTRTNGRTQYLHENYETVVAVPYDIPVVGYHNGAVNTLRLWAAEAYTASNFCSARPEDRWDCGDAIQYRRRVESITDTLYPDDTGHEGKVLRLKQHYFLVSAGLQSILRDYRERNDRLEDLPAKVAVHINDTHPALAIPELMRILTDEAGLEWEEAWQLTVRTMSYTNHTVLPEALEKWPVEIMQSLLPRIYLIIHEINEQYCRSLWRSYPGEWDKIRQMAIIADGQVHMAHLAIVGSHSINGVAKIHTEILKKQVMKQFSDYYPERFRNVTNGVTHRRWLLKANPLLAELITGAIGPGWIDRPCELSRLSRYAIDPAFQDQLAQVKLHNKVALAKFAKARYDVSLDIHSIFDAQVKRIHAYKRQSMNVMHIMDLYNRLRDNPGLDEPPRTFIFAGKAAPGYYRAKSTIRLICALADKINNDKLIKDKIKVLFLENYNVSYAELIIPASDVSEQIPTASREACGTGNMKFMMNGAVTIGTLDGANIEIQQAVGPENIIVFGLTAEEVLGYYRKGGYNPWDVYHQDPRVRTIMEQLVSGFLSGDKDEFRSHYNAFLHENDEYFLLKDFGPFMAAQQELANRYRDRARWRKMCVHNIAQSGKFSGDRTFAEYSLAIWRVNRDDVARCYCKSDESFMISQTGCERSGELGVTH